LAAVWCLEGCRQHKHSSRTGCSNY